MTMRLLNTNTGQFEEFMGQNVPEYAILSHTWEDEEVSFKDMSSPGYKSKKGFAKISMTCQLAAAAGIRYAWVDTCCIDKSSSAELTEAINSMFLWYCRASVCYAYLSDLSPSASLTAGLPQCRWLTRGWTLQELIAPKLVTFFDQCWNIRGSKPDLICELADITGIDADILSHSKPLASVAVAQKMSWAAKRQTTRVEDTAYCLLGIFDVNMPLLYGEEEKAFRRLQEEIIKATPDYSIFAWTISPSSLHWSQLEAIDGRRYSGVLAASPHEFIDCGSMDKFEDTDLTSDFSVSNQGIRLYARFRIKSTSRAQGQQYILPICTAASGMTLGIALRKCGPGRYARENPHLLLTLTATSWNSTPRSRFLVTQLDPVLKQVDTRIYDDRAVLSGRPCALHVRLPPEFVVDTIWPWHRWDDEDQLFFIGSNSRRDWSAAVITGLFNVHVGSRQIRSNVAFMIYALGWGNPDHRSPQCTVFDHRVLDASILREMTTRIEERDQLEPVVREALVENEIPQTPVAVFAESLDSSDRKIVVSLTTKLATDAKICPQPFWCLELSWKLCSANEAPPIHNTKWEIEHE
jgi:Heterokaryon incompatibility protein (HET)